MLYFESYTSNLLTVSDETRPKVKPTLTARSRSHCCAKAQNWEQKREPEPSLLTGLSLDLLSLALERAGFVAPSRNLLSTLPAASGLPALTAGAAPEVLRGHRGSPPRQRYRYVTVMGTGKMEPCRTGSVRRCCRGEGRCGALAARGVMHPPPTNSCPCWLAVGLSFCKVLWCLLETYFYCASVKSWRIHGSSTWAWEKGLATLLPPCGDLGKTDPDELQPKQFLVWGSGSVNLVFTVPQFPSTAITTKSC